MDSFRITPTTRVLVLSGAGVSAESGVPTFRGMNGLWEGNPVERVASPEGFRADPALVWRFYGLRRESAAKVEPNPGHRALVKLERALGDRFLLATQNVDGLHQRAGSRNVIAMHGELFKSRCERCNEPFDDHKTYLGEPLPTCSRCAGAVRPHIVWFGEMLDPQHLERIERFIKQVGSSLIFIAVGTSGQVFPAAGIVDAVNANGGTTWLIDAAPSDAYAERFDHVRRGKSGELLPQLIDEALSGVAPR